jgi:uncharacterized membrane protein YqjE
MDSAPQGESGIAATLARVLQTLRETAVTRLELFLLEAKEERLRLFDALLIAAAGVVFSLMTLIMVTLTIVVFFWETHRMAALAILSLAYAGGATAAMVSLRSRLKRWRAFSATLDQLKKDFACSRKTN